MATHDPISDLITRVAGCSIEGCVDRAGRALDSRGGVFPSLFLATFLLILLSTLLIEGLNAPGAQETMQRLGRLIVRLAGGLVPRITALRRPGSWPQWYGQGNCLVGTVDLSRGLWREV